MQLRAASGRGGGRGQTEADGDMVVASTARPPMAVRELDDVADFEGGLRLIDDGLGESAAFPAFGGGGSGGGGWGAGGGAWGGRAGRPAAPQALEEEFPTLAAAAAVTSSGITSSASGQRLPWQQQQQQQQQPSATVVQLVKATSRCPCGRRAVHYALRPDEQPPPLGCDVGCEAHNRRRQLAGAFGVADPEHHVSYFDRHRTPDYSPTLLQVGSVRMHGHQDNSMIFQCKLLLSLCTHDASDCNLAHSRLHKTTFRG